MRMHISGIHGQSSGSVAQIAQEMTVKIAQRLGFQEMGFYCCNLEKESRECLRARMDGIIAGLTVGDILVFQHPTWMGIHFEKTFLEHIRAYRLKLAIFIQDVPPMMFESNKNMLPEYIELYNEAQVLIVPSEAMKCFLLEHGVRKDMRFVIQEIWDQITTVQTESVEFRKLMHFAGKPDKFVFPDTWDYPVPLRVYARDNAKGSNAENAGWKTQSQLLLELSAGGFGLVWYGDEYWHEYMRYNNTYKLSTYLSAGIPVIVPRGISNQKLIEENGLGFAVDTLEEAVQKVEDMQETEYLAYAKRVEKFSWLMKQGFFTEKILLSTVHALLRDDW